MNRGIARRTVFENDRDVRYFLSRLARAVRAGWIEVHAYCVMTTHFHLLVRSTDGCLSHAMERVLNDYVRWFNRRRKRDGSLFRGRFRSRPVDSLGYRRRLVSYIDDNPVLARLVPEPLLYPHGSARHYARLRGPRWMNREWIEDQVRATIGSDEYDAQSYRACFGGHASSALARVVERRIEIRSRGRDPLDDLLGAAPLQVLAWMRRKAALADGTRIDLPVCDPDLVKQRVADEHLRRGPWSIELSRKRSCAWRLLEVALLRELCMCSWTEIGARIQTAEQGALRAYGLHVRALTEQADYAQVVGRIGAQAIEHCYGARQTVGASGVPSPPRLRRFRC